MVLYMAVTDDEYELPLIVEEHLTELAKKMGTTSKKISSSIYNTKRIRKEMRQPYRKKVRYVRVDVDDEN